MTPKSTKPATACDGNGLNFTGVSGETLRKNSDKFPFLQSKIEPSGIILHIGTITYYFELKRIHGYAFIPKTETLIYKYGSSPTRTHYGELATKLYTALTAWHAGGANG